MAKVTEASSLGFLNLWRNNQGNGYLGAILVTDLLGIPEEFRCTEPVKPNEVQKRLFADTLEPYIGVNLISEPLIKALKKKPDLIIIKEPLLVDVRTKGSTPTVLVSKTGVKPLFDSPIRVVDEDVVSTARTLKSSNEKFKPYAIYSHPDKKEDLNFAAEVLSVATQNLFVLEPFDRIASAMEVVIQKDKKYQ